MNRLAVKKRVRILEALCKPMPLRAIAKSVPASLNSITRLLAAAGTAATIHHHRHVRGLKSRRVVCEDFNPFEDRQRARVPRDPDSGLILAWRLDDETDGVPQLAE